MTLRKTAAAFVLALILVPSFAQAGPKRAKNVILFLADAGGIPTLNAASLYGYHAPLGLHVQGCRTSGSRIRPRWAAS